MSIDAKRWGGAANRWPIAISACAAVWLVSGQALAAPVGDVTPLGRSLSSGAVCQAVRDYGDPLAQHPAARAWSIRCLGWDIPIGRIYRLRPADVAAWRRDFAVRTACQSVKHEPLTGFAFTEQTLCRSQPLNIPYIGYVARRGRFTDIAEGFAQTADVLEAGLKVTAGVMAPPAALASQSSQAAAAVAAEFGGDSSGLASAEKAAKGDPQRLIARGYVQNSEWRFDAAETDFRALADAARSAKTPPGERARAILNLALNVSDNGRFKEASALFASADADIAASGDQALKAEAFNYRAYHLRNQQMFAAAAAMAETALAARVQARASASFAAAKIQAVRQSDPRIINESLSDALNVRLAGGALIGDAGVSEDIRLTLQDAEAYEIEGSCKLALGDSAGALTALEQARARLQSADNQGADTSGLRARVEADIGQEDLASGRPEAAVEQYRSALIALRARHAGSSPEGRLLLDLGRAQIAAGATDAALDSFGQAFAVFKTARGSLGSSADAAAPYFDLLITLSQKQPDHAADYAARFFAASQAVVSDATASTISRLAARVASGDDATAGLVRAVDDTRRELAAAESRIAALQTRNAYVGDAKIAAEAELKQLQTQLAAVNEALLNANPRYDQLVSADATLGDLQKALRPGEVYLKTLLLGGRGYGILISPEAAVPYAIPMERQAVVDAAAALRAPMEGAGESLDDFDVAASHDLFKTLFGPVSDRLLKARHLIYEPDSKLISLPVSLFVTDQASVDRVKARTHAANQPGDYRDVAWLGAKLDSSLVLSASTFLQARTFQPSHARRLFRGFGDPELARADPRAYAALFREGAASLAQTSDAARVRKICDASRAALLKIDALPDTDKEVHVIAASLSAPADDVTTGQAFDDAAIRASQGLGDYKILYFATHALLPMPDACVPEPALLTSLGAGDSQGALDASDIVKLKLDAELIVLSACDTGGSGSSDDSQSGLAGGGEALGGLTRAFIYAGARGLLVSHWSVDSAATERLMTSLFSSPADTEAQALQRAQAQMQADPRMSHPYFWAPFTIVGDGGRPIPSALAPIRAAVVNSR
jgi:CHAT domain-containing protein